MFIANTMNKRIRPSTGSYLILKMHYYKHIIPLGLGFCHANLTPHSSSHTTIIFCATFVHFAVNHPTVAEQILRYTQNDKELITSHTCFKERPLRPLMSFTLNYSLFTAHSSPLTPYSLLLTPYSSPLTLHSSLLTHPHTSVHNTVNNRQR